VSGFDDDVPRHAWEDEDAPERRRRSPGPDLLRPAVAAQDAVARLEGQNARNDRI